MSSENEGNTKENIEGKTMQKQIKTGLKGNKNALKHGFYASKAGLTRKQVSYIRDFVSVACGGAKPQDLVLVHVVARQLSRLLRIYKWIDSHPEDLSPPFSSHLICLENSVLRSLDRLQMSPGSRAKLGVKQRGKRDWCLELSEGK